MVHECHIRTKGPIVELSTCEMARLLRLGIGIEDEDMTRKLLIVILAFFGNCKAVPRANVVIRGTTVGPDWVRPSSGLCK